VVCVSNARRWPGHFFLCTVAAGMISTLGNSTQMAVQSDGTSNSRRRQ